MANCSDSARVVLLKHLASTKSFQNYFGSRQKNMVTLNEVEALLELYNKLSSSVVNNGFIQKEELQLALFRNSNKQNLFTDRIFSLFDKNHNGHVDFGEFVRSLSIFHPKTPEADKILYAFRLYDLSQTGYIEQGELKEMMLALLTESDLTLSDDVIEAIVNKTFVEVDTKGDGRIDREEWKVFVGKNPSLLKNMTLPYLMDITLGFPSFVINTNAEDTDL